MPFVWRQRYWEMGDQGAVQNRVKQRSMKLLVLSRVEMGANIWVYTGLSAYSGSWGQGYYYIENKDSIIKGVDGGMGMYLFTKIDRNMVIMFKGEPSITFLLSYIQSTSKMFAGSAHTDKMIKEYVDRIFVHYDRNRSGTLDARQLQHFLNDLYLSMGSSHKVSREQAQRAIKSVDLNGDGRLDRAQLVLAFKNLQEQQQAKMRYIQSAQLQQQQYLAQMKAQKQQGQALQSPHRPAQQPRPTIQQRPLGVYDTPQPYHPQPTHNTPPRQPAKGPWKTPC